MTECCPGGTCSPAPTGDGLDRREFVKLISVGAIGGWLGAAGPFAPSDVRPDIDHFVPADKKLPAAWVRALTERGEPTIYSGETAEALGMPCGGIGTGEVYLLGDGRLGRFDVFNRHRDTGYGLRNYEFLVPETPIAQSFDVEVIRADKTSRTWTLDRSGFTSVEFVGQYPVAEIRYSDPACPVRVTLRVFSPFIPLDAASSGFPATCFAWKIENVSDAEVGVKLTGRFENAVLRDNRQDLDLEDRTRSDSIRGAGGKRAASMVVFEMASSAPRTDGGTESRPTRVLGDFEGDDWGEWKAEGAAMGSKPARGKAPTQQRVTGFKGRGLVNSYANTDDARGKLTSPDFVVDRRWLNFLMGGGAGRNVGLRLVVDGATVRTAQGRNDERLTWQRMDVSKWSGKTARIEIFDDADGPWGHVNVDQIELSDHPRAGDLDDVTKLADFGTFALAMLEDASGPGHLATAIDRGVSPTRGAVTALIELKPKESAQEIAILAWHFPNHPRGRNYANRFKSAKDVVAAIAESWDRLHDGTMAWHRAFYGGTLPNWFLERVHAPIANLATSLVEWRGDGRLWAWEGVGCCAGTCTHVWNYAHGMARLFPELERNVRERQDLGEGFDEASGLVGFRGNRAYAADGQCGTVLKIYREHLCSADRGFLERTWPRTRKALEFAIARDGNADGILEDAQPNTYDIDFFGANTFVGALYLAALRAGEEMARRMNDDAFATKCRQLFDRGSAATMARLWNGEYFRQDVDVERHGEWQYADGCLADQLFGQAWAAQVGLGLLYPRDATRTALQSIYRYNWAPDVGPQNARHVPERYFARRGEAGLFICTWPRSKHPGNAGVRYRDEVWTGCEYQFASNLIHEGFLTEGLAVVRGVHERYDGRKHNPWNEVECGDHYARALASWGCFVAICGFQHDGPAGVIGFDPRVSPERFEAAFTGAEGFGTFRQERDGSTFRAKLDATWGRVRLTRVIVAPGGPRASVVASVAGKPLAGTRIEPDSRDPRVAAVIFPDGVSLEAGSLTIEIPV